MPRDKDNPPYSADTALALYFAALIRMAEGEKEQAERFWRIHQNIYTERRLQWARNQLAAFKAGERYLGNWRRIIRRYVNPSPEQGTPATSTFRLDAPTAEGQCDSQNT